MPLNPPEIPRAALLALEHVILQKLATGETVAGAMDDLCRRVERLAPTVRATILTVHEGRLYPLASPSMPERYASLVSGTEIGPNVGSCGTAAWRGEPVTVRDIRTDPLWRDFQDLPLPEEVRACWSSPIKSREGQVIGTFAFYFNEVRGPSALDEQIVDVCVHLCSVAIESDMARSETRRLAFQDTVTGLMNRTTFQERASHALRAVEDGSEAVAVHIIDVDEFKAINDTLGHHVGDLLLAAMADRLRRVGEQNGAVARIGGDEFAILQRNASREAAAGLAWEILEAFSAPFYVEEHQISANASIGIAFAAAGDECCTLADIMKNADLALYGAKADGRGRYRFFTQDLAETLQSRRAISNDLHRALDRKEFALVFQPIVCLKTRALVGCEALIRWHSASRGEVPPETFIPLAEEIGLIDRIGDWVMGEACRQAARWPDPLRVSINISPRQLRHANFPQKMRQMALDAGIEPRRVTLEITETAILDNDSTTRECLRVLRSHGFRLALDDFGTGYSSLKSLRAVPIDKIKIDQSFVAEFGESDASTSIVKAIVALAHSLGIQTTAEGIETQELARLLDAAGCEEGQGFYFSRPLSAEAAYAFCLRIAGTGMAVRSARA